MQVTQALRDVSGTSIPASATMRHLKRAGSKAVVKKKKPLLTARHRKNRLEFALGHRHWTVDDWKRVIFSDETKIDRLGSHGRRWAWKLPGEGPSDRLVEGTLTFGCSHLMMWGAMYQEGVGFTCRIEGTMDADLYTQILEEEMQQSLEWYGLDVQDIIFQQDNDPKHTSKKAKQWFKDHGFEVMSWPAQSPDLNPIEHLWNHLKRKLGEYDTPLKGEGEHWRRVEKEWNEIPDSVCRNLVASMPRRIEAVIKAKGGYTKY